MEYGITLGQGVRLGEINQFIEWVQTKMGEIQRFVESAGKIVNVALPKAIGEPGEPGVVDEIVYVAQRLGQVYHRLVEWSIDFAHVQTDEEFTGVLRIVSRASQNVMCELEAFSQTIQNEISRAVSCYEATGEPQSLEISLTMTCPNMDDLDAELRKLAARLGIPY